MADKMLIDATHPEETRVVVLRGNRVEEFDFESANRKQLRGNIYLAKVTRVEPSLQAAFVDYGGNRHGFLAFSEIHPDYYQIPVADRQALLAEEERAQHEADSEADNRSNRRGGRHRRRGANRRRDVRRSDVVAEEAAIDGTDQPKDAAADSDLIGGEASAQIEAAETEIAEISPQSQEAIAEQSTDIPLYAPTEVSAAPAAPVAEGEHAPAEPATEIAPIETPVGDTQDDIAAGTHEGPEEEEEESLVEAASADANDDAQSNGNGEGNGHGDDHEEVESVGGADALEEVQERLPRFRRQYKIQEVIKRRQVMLVQVVKEERGTKGAALTTYLSLAGRYSVLMPNTARGGGISRKITSAEDRNRLKEIAQELEVPEGMGVILRTAGANRTKTEVKRDFEYLLRLWETVRDLTLKSTAPKLVYEEGSLVKRSIRDLYNKDIDEIVVSGEQGYQEARDFMRMLMPSHVKHVKQYKDNLPLFTRYVIEGQLDAMFSPVVQLRSGGYIVINQTEALVAIDVNSGRATREHHIEDTALKTNVEAAEEIARQLRLRDLAGLIVIDFIDMDESRNNRTVERRLKEALKHDRARIQVGRISHFGLLEMSRQRIRTSVLESSTEKCPICGGSGHVRSVSSVALHLLRAVEEMLIKGATHNLVVRTRSEVALYVLNHKRAHLRELEERFRITLTISADDEVPGQQAYLIERGEQVHSVEDARNLAQAAAQAVSALAVEDEGPLDTESEAEEESEAEAEAEAEETPGESDQGGRRRRRRRGRGRARGEAREDAEQPFTDETVAEHAIAHEDHDAGSPEENGFDHEAEHAVHAGGESEDRDSRRRRRRGRRGGRRNRRGREGHDGHESLHANGYDETAEGFQAADEHAEEATAPEAREHGEQGGENAVPAFVHETPPHEPAFERPLNPPTAEAEYPAPAVPQASAESSATEAHAPASEEAPRRRSTVREPAPLSGEAAAAPVPSPASSPTPVISVSSGEETAPPKRGWWGKRLLGNKG